MPKTLLGIIGAGVFIFNFAPSVEWLVIPYLFIAIPVAILIVIVGMMDT